MLSQKFVLPKSKNSTSSLGIRMPPTIPINHYFGLANQQNKTRVLFHHSMLNCSRHKACYEHSNFFKVKVPSPSTRQLSRSTRGTGKKPRTRQCSPCGGPNAPGPTFDYELFNSNNFSIHSWSWNYRGCWHQTCPPMDTR